MPDIDEKTSQYRRPELQTHLPYHKQRPKSHTKENSIQLRNKRRTPRTLTSFFGPDDKSVAKPRFLGVEPSGAKDLRRQVEAIFTSKLGESDSLERQSSWDPGEVGSVGEEVLI